MASLEMQISALQNDPNLSPFIMKDAISTGRTLGSGSYGSVEEIKVDELVCAGKIIHELLLGGEAEDIIAQKYVRECQLMAGLRHPNVTQFLGLCFLPPRKLPVLVMEKLEGSLDDLLETVPNIPLALKRSILEDVARGLLYLHRRDPPIIHRDLSANNVLLTTSFTAKITDLGNSRIVCEPEKLKLTQVPGATTYMPPEALNMDPHYGTSLDIFSFGHLGLFTGLQIYPAELLAHNYRDPDLGRLVGRTELERREQYIKQLENSFPSGEQHPFVRLIKQCLQDIPSERPSTEVLLKTLEDMRSEIEGPFGSYDMAKQDLMRQVTVTRTLKTLKQSEAKVLMMEAEIKRLQEELLLAKEEPVKQKEGMSTKQESEDSQYGLIVGEEYKEGEHWAKVKLVEERAYHELYLGNDLAKGTFFFIKQMQYERNHLSDQKEAREGIMDEINILSRVHHPNIIRYFGHSEDKKYNIIYIFLEYKWMAGEHLQNVLELIKHPFSESVISTYTRQITSGIVYLHDNGIIHKDLNGTNILCEYSGHRVCISGFGMQTEKLSCKNSGHEEFRNFEETAPFLAPAVIRGEIQAYESTDSDFEKKSKCDVWSIGCVIILMATGKPPWLDQFVDVQVNKLALIFKIGMATEPPTLPDFSNPTLKDFTTRCLKIDPTDRPTSSELLKHPLMVVETEELSK